MPEQQPHAHARRVVHVEELDRRASLRCESAQRSMLVEDEMFRPGLTSGMKEGHDRACFRVDRGDVRPLLQVASDAAQTEIVQVVGSSMLSPDDVIDLVR